MILSPPAAPCPPVARGRHRRPAVGRRRFHTSVPKFEDGFMKGSYSWDWA